MAAIKVVLIVLPVDLREQFLVLSTSTGRATQDGPEHVSLIPPSKSVRTGYELETSAADPFVSKHFI